jgi:hypothetical protein
LSLATEPPEAPGRLTAPLQPAGFEVLAGVRPRDVPVAAAPPPRQSGSDPVVGAGAAVREASGRRAVAALERERREASAALTSAESALELSNRRAKEAEQQEARARSEWERTKKALDQAQHEVERATAATVLARQRLQASKAR